LTKHPPEKEKQMMRVSYGCDDLGPSNLKKLCQLGVDCVDFGSGDFFPGVKEQGYPDLDELLKIKKQIQSWGMEMNRVTLPDVTERYFLDKEGGEKDVENTVNAMRVFGESKIPIARQRFEGDTFNHLLTHYRSEHRAGFLGHGDTLAHVNPEKLASLTQDELHKWWNYFCKVYAKHAKLCSPRLLPPDFRRKHHVHNLDAY
jgi:mannonate dehydratase